MKNKNREKILYKIWSWLFFLFLTAYPFGQLLRLPFFKIFPDVHVYFSDLLLFGAIVSWFFWRIFAKEKWPALFVWLLVFLFSAFFSLFLNFFKYSFGEDLVGLSYCFRLTFYWFLYPLALDFIKKDNGKFLSVRVLVTLGVVLALFGFYQLLFYPNQKAFEIYNWDPHFYRLTSTFLDPGFTGIIFVFTLILISGRILETGNLLGKRFFLIPWLLVYTALTLTYSRSSYLAFLVGMWILSLFKKNLKFAIGVTLLVIFTLALVPRPEGEGGKLGRTYTIKARFINFKQAITVIRDNPIFGVGFNTLKYAKENYGFWEEDWQGSHSAAGFDVSLLFFWATSGILGLAALLVFIGKIILFSIGGRFGYWSEIYLAMLIALGVNSIFVNSFFYPWVIVWLAIGLAFVEFEKIRVDI